MKNEFTMKKEFDVEKEFDAVVFDMDGVIFDSEKLVIECWQVIADKYGIKNIADACHECLGLNRDATREKMLLRYGADLFWKS